MARLLSVNVGLPRDVSWQGEKVFTSVWKEPVQGRGKVRRLNVDGDGQGDLSGHGGEHRAVLVYQMESYRYWEQQLGRTDFIFGQFGENFTVEGLPDGEVCIGDRYRIGRALFEVTQSRVTCYRVGIRMGEPRMAALLVSHHRSRTVPLGAQDAYHQLLIFKTMHDRDSWIEPLREAFEKVVKNAKPQLLPAPGYPGRCESSVLIRFHVANRRLLNLTRQRPLILARENSYWSAYRLVAARSARSSCAVRRGP